MYLSKNLKFKTYLWDNFSIALMGRLKLELGNRLPSIFALNDIKTLLSLDSKEIQERIAIAQLCVVEGIIVVALNEAFKPITFISELKEPFTVSVKSTFRYGLEHHILEPKDQAGFLYFENYPTNPSRNTDPRLFLEIDTLNTYLIDFETKERDSKRFSI